MPTELDNTVKAVVEKVGTFVEGAFRMTVETKYVKIDAKANEAANFDLAKPIARTIVQVNGDSETIIPVHEGPDGSLQLDSSLLDLHQKHVDAAMQYRADILSTLLSAVHAAKV